MGIPSVTTDSRNFDLVLRDLSSLPKDGLLSDIANSLLEDDYPNILRHSTARKLFARVLEQISSQVKEPPSPRSFAEEGDIHPTCALIIGLAAFNAFLQANVTGPPFSARSLLFGDELD